MLLIFVSPLMRSPLVAHDPVLHDQLAKTIVGSAIDADIALPFEGEAESERQKFFPGC